MAGEGKYGVHADQVYFDQDGQRVTLPEQLATIGGGAPAWSEVTGKPAVFPPASHTHEVGDVDGLTSALEGKQATGDYATTATVTALTGRVSSLEDAEPVITRAEFDALLVRVDALETPEE